MTLTPIHRACLYYVTCTPYQSHTDYRQLPKVPAGTWYSTKHVPGTVCTQVGNVHGWISKPNSGCHVVTDWEEEGSHKIDILVPSLAHTTKDAAVWASSFAGCESSELTRWCKWFPHEVLLGWQERRKHGNHGPKTKRTCWSNVIFDQQFQSFLACRTNNNGGQSVSLAWATALRWIKSKTLQNDFTCAVIFLSRMLRARTHVALPCGESRCTKSRFMSDRCQQADKKGVSPLNSVPTLC